MRLDEGVIPEGSDESGPHTPGDEAPAALEEAISAEADRNSD